MSAPGLAPKRCRAVRGDRAAVACGLAVALGLSVMLSSPVVTAQATKARPTLSQSLTGSAKEDFEAGKLLATDGDYAGALIKFQSAYDKSKDVRLLWNVAFCHKNLRRYSKVLSTLRRYIDEGATTLSAADKRDAEELIGLIEPFTTQVQLRVTESGAAVYVDEELLGTSPLAEAVALDLGERRLRVVKEGFVPFEKTLVIGGSSRLTLDIPLQKEVQVGQLLVHAPPGATILVDGRALGTGTLSQAFTSGAHQLQVTAPGMRPFQTEIVLQARETRSVEVVLEATAAAVKPLLRVAVGCGNEEPRSPEEGLVLYLDGPDVLPPLSVKRQWSDEHQQNVVQWVEYAVAPGHHQLKVRTTGCLAGDVEVDVDAAKGAEVHGTLRSDTNVLLRGPLGSPGWYRLGLGLYMPFGGVTEEVPEDYRGKPGDVVGVALELGLVSRWFGATANVSYGAGSFQRETHLTHYALPEQAETSFSQWSVRVGPRFPFNLVALSLGPEFGVQALDLERVRTGRKEGLFGVFTQLEVQPLCDFGLFALGRFDKPANREGPVGSLTIGLQLQPSASCRQERGSRLGLQAKSQ
jgi:hypothetical protein